LLSIAGEIPAGAAGQPSPLIIQTERDSVAVFGLLKRYRWDRIVIKLE
jgi:hypothetical protein